MSWIAAAVLAAMAPHVAPASEAAAAPFECTFASSWSECGLRAQAATPDRITLAEVAGVHGVRLQTLPGDEGIAGSGRAERTDLALSSAITGCSEGAEQWWAHSLLFPDDYRLPQVTDADRWPWGVVFDFHQTGSTGQANYEVEIAGESPQLRLAISAGPVVSDGAPGSPTRRWTIGPVVKNHWYRFVYHVRWSAGSGGFFDAWIDGRQALAYRGPTLYTGQACYLKLANYHTPVGAPVSVVHAQVVRAATREGLSR